MNIEACAAQLGRVRKMVGGVVVGYDEVVTDLLVALIAGGHVLLEGVPGVAKTTLAKTFSHAIGTGFARIQFTQDLLPADITGHYFYDQKVQEFKLRRGAVFSNLLLADEINRAPPKTQSALLEAMEERQVTIEGNTYPLERPFLVIATMNPIDLEGVYRLPEAQLDRFMLRARMSYLPRDLELQMLEGKLGAPFTEEAVLASSTIARAQELAGTVHVSREVLGYLHALGLALREHPGVRLGPSPRALEQLVRAARAYAIIEGRDHVLPDDVKMLLPRTMTHRLILDMDAESEGVTALGIVEETRARVPIPKGRGG